jgi:hypothetical protein
MWSVARFDLGLASSEFWSLAPRQYVALLRRKRLDAIEREWGPALIASTFVNVFTSRKSKDILTPADLMPTLINTRKKVPEEDNVDRMMSLAKAVTKSLGGTVGTHSS